jgi:hypothetical protein
MRLRRNAGKQRKPASFSELKNYNVIAEKPCRTFVHTSKVLNAFTTALEVKHNYIKPSVIRQKRKILFHTSPE